MMHRREWLRAGVGMAGATLVSARTSRGDDPSPSTDPAEALKNLGPLLAMPITATRLTDRIHLMQGPGGNIAVFAGPEGLIVVDSGVPTRALEIVAEAKKAGGKPITTLIDTHWHFDHAGGNLAFAREGAKIIGTPNTRKRLATDQYTEIFKMTTPASPPEALPSLTFDESTIHVGGEEIHMVSVPPAHTDGDLIVHFKRADVIHTGDLFSNGFYPNVDASSRGWLGGMVAAADRLLKLAGPSTKIIPGHGPLADVADLAAYRKMLATIYDRLAPMVAAGKTIDDAIAAAPTKDLDPTWGKGLFNGGMFTRLVYDGLLKHRQES